MSGPATLTFRIRVPSDGAAPIELVPRSESKAEEWVRFRYSVKPDEWQEVTVDLAQQGPSSILGLYLPGAEESVEIDWIELKPTGHPARRWGF